MDDSDEETKCATDSGKTPQNNLLPQRDIDIDVDDMDELQIDSGSDMAISDNGATNDNRGDGAHQHSEEQSSQEIRRTHDTLLELEDEEMEITPEKCFHGDSPVDGTASSPDFEVGAPESRPQHHCH
ncbi:unnamed protein product [Peronospora destructor]|uniref:Uncharacterized protein n=1 Tax=Peronospora destructor TaxID=86335 RepID=A0AAV0THQ4_9STRA|nr:unnamed protein product [Peronospora destructor]